MHILAAILLTASAASLAASAPPAPSNGRLFSLRFPSTASPSELAGKPLLYSLPESPYPRTRLGYSPNKSWQQFVGTFTPTPPRQLQPPPPGLRTRLGYITQLGQPSTTKLYLKRTFSETLPAYLSRIGNPRDDPDPADAANLVNRFGVVKGKLGYHIGPEIGEEERKEVETVWTPCRVPDEEVSWELYFGKPQGEAGKECGAPTSLEVVWG